MWGGGWGVPGGGYSKGRKEEGEGGLSTMRQTATRRGSSFVNVIFTQTFPH